jgi:hypothetical protein
VAGELEVRGASNVKFNIGDLVRRKPEHTIYETQKGFGIVTGILLGELVRVSWGHAQKEAILPEYKLERASALKG